MSVIDKTRRLQGPVLAWLFVALGHMAVAAVPAGQTDLVNVGILPFQDDSGTHAPPDLLQKISRDLRLKMSAAHKDLLGRALSGEASDAGLEQLTDLGRQQGFQLVIRGALLAVASESTADELRCRLELYCDVIDVGSGSVSTFRSEGDGAEERSSREDALQWDSYAWEDPGLAATALGLALDAALDGLVEHVHSAALSLSGRAEAVEETAAAVEPAEEGEPALADDSYEADQDLQQLIAQAESLISAEGAAGLIDIGPLQASLESLLASLNAKLSLLGQAQDTTAIDDQILLKKEELRGLVDASTEQLASASVETGQLEEVPSGADSELTATLKELLSGVLDRLVGIQEAEASLEAESGEEYEESLPADAEDSDAYYAEEGAGSDVSGIVVDEEGDPIEGVTVVEPETGASAVTDAGGSYFIPSIPSGRVVGLHVVQGGRTIATGKIDVRPGKTGIADWVVRPRSGGLSAPANTVLPSATILRRKGAAPGGGVRGVVLSATGRPVPLVLVKIPGVGSVRTDASGRYFFANVPPGRHELIVQHRQGGAQAQKIVVAASKTAELKTVYRPRAALVTARSPVVTRGGRVVVYGRVLDSRGKPIRQARVWIDQPMGGLAVLTNASGKYELQNVLPGFHRIGAGKKGFETSSSVADLREKTSILLDFRLKPAPAGPLAEVAAGHGPLKITPRSERPPAAAKNTRDVRPKTAEDEAAKSSASKTAPKSATASDSAKTSKSTKTATRAPMLKTATTAKGTVQGRIVDAKSGKAVVGASVAIKGKPAVKTDATGRFRFSDLAAGTYAATVRKTGYKDGTGSFTVKAGATASVQIRLAPLSLIKK